MKSDMDIHRAVAAGAHHTLSKCAFAVIQWCKLQDEFEGALLQWW